MMNKSLEEIYGALEGARQSYLNRANIVAGLTIPTAFEPDGHDNDYYLPNQSLGSTGVMNIVSKVVNALFPISRPFAVFNYTGELPQDPQEIEVLKLALSELNAIVKNFFEEISIRPSLETAVTQLIITGNILVLFNDDLSVKLFPLHSFVVQRRADESAITIIAKEVLYRTELDDWKEEWKEMLDEERISFDDEKDITDVSTEEITVYTGCLWDAKKKRYEVYQEIDRERVGESRTYKKEDCPFLAVKCGDIGDIAKDYSNGYAWGIIADLAAFDEYSKHLSDLAKQKTRQVTFLDQTAPLGQRISPKDLEEAQNGSVLLGNANTITSWQCMQNVDSRDIYEQYSLLAGNVKKFFMFGAGGSELTRDRVTATEIQSLSSEGDNLLGGLYNRLSQALQLPIVYLLIAQLQRKKRITDLNKFNIRPSVIAGFEALGKNMESNELIQAISVLPQPAAQYINWYEFASSFLNMRGVNIKNMLFTPAQIQEMQQAAMASEAMKNATPQVATEIIKQQGNV
jgi:hypothetical protein